MARVADPSYTPGRDHAAAHARAHAAEHAEPDVRDHDVRREREGGIWGIDEA